MVFQNIHCAAFIDLWVPIYGDRCLKIFEKMTASQFFKPLVVFHQKGCRSSEARCVCVRSTSSSTVGRPATPVSGASRTRCFSHGIGQHTAITSQLYMATLQDFNHFKQVISSDYMIQPITIWSIDIHLCCLRLVPGLTALHGRQRR